MTMQMNVPEPVELLDQEDEKKVKEEKEVKISNACTYTIYKEDHTVGNVLQTQLLKSNRILFAGYKAPHPLENKIELKIQTNDPGYQPRKALKHAIHEIKTNLSQLKKQFSDQVENARKKFNSENYDDDEQMGDSYDTGSGWD